MAFTAKPRTFTASVSETVLGVGDSALTLGGANVLPLYYFDAPAKNLPAVGVEITDTGFETGNLPALAACYGDGGSAAERAKKAARMEGAGFVCLRFEGADPGGQNKSAAECAAIAKEVVEAIDKPLVIAGCKNAEKDAEVFSAWPRRARYKTSSSCPPGGKYKTVGGRAPWRTARRSAPRARWTSPSPSS